MCISGLEKACLELSNIVLSKICSWQDSWIPRASVSPSVSPPWGCWPSFCECFKVWVSRSLLLHMKQRCLLITSTKPPGCPPQTNQNASFAGDPIACSSPSGAAMPPVPAGHHRRWERSPWRLAGDLWQSRRSTQHRAHQACRKMVCDPDTSCIIVCLWLIRNLCTLLKKINLSISFI